MALPFTLTTKAKVRNMLRPGQTSDGRVVLRLGVSINDDDYVLNVVGRQGQGVEELVNELVRSKLLVKDGNDWFIEVPTWQVTKAKNATIWVHWEDYERLKGSRTTASA
ncbi:MAG: hypothetical protein L7H00_02925 [Vulcanisaeta sp.]|nr:hypothetical protein [Vulcanisaeta sp.]MCG2892465.1 hypothetical protein [Vulcanisaeta sp.]MCG2894843.1 hypothetical protein [Vulcanisaeta sp.]